MKKGFVFGSWVPHWSAECLAKATNKQATCTARKKFSKQKAKAAFFVESFPRKGPRVAASLESPSTMRCAICYMRCVAFVEHRLRLAVVASASTVSVSLAGWRCICISECICICFSVSFPVFWPGFSLSFSSGFGLAARFCRCYDTNINRWKLLLAVLVLVVVVLVLVFLLV